MMDKLLRNREICRAYQAGGVSLRDLAAKHGLSLERVRQILHQHGVSTEYRPRVLTPDEEAKVVTLWNRGHSQDDVARALGVARVIVRNFLRRTGRTPTFDPNNCKAWTEAEMEFVRAHRPARTFGWIAARLGRTRNSVIGIAYRLGLCTPHDIPEDSEMNAVQGG